MSFLRPFGWVPKASFVGDLNVGEEGVAGDKGSPVAYNRDVVEKSSSSSNPTAPYFQAGQTSVFNLADYLVAHSPTTNYPLFRYVFIPNNMYIEDNTNNFQTGRTWKCSIRNANTEMDVSDLFRFSGKIRLQAVEFGNSFICPNATANLQVFVTDDGDSGDDDSSIIDIYRLDNHTEDITVTNIDPLKLTCYDVSGTKIKLYSWQDGILLAETIVKGVSEMTLSYPSEYENSTKMITAQAPGKSPSYILICR